MNFFVDVKVLVLICVDIFGIESGMYLIVKWFGKLVFICCCILVEIEEVCVVFLVDFIIDVDLCNDNKSGIDVVDENCVLDENGEWLVMIGVCIYFGCVLLSDVGDFVGFEVVGGWFCLCYGFYYDIFGCICRGLVFENFFVFVVCFEGSELVFG